MLEFLYTLLWWIFVLAVIAAITVCVFESNIFVRVPSPPVPVIPKSPYPSDPQDPYYKAFKTVPSLNVTVEKFKKNFVDYTQTADIVDTVIVLDGSGSIPHGDFSRAKEALKHMMEKLNNPKSDSKFAAVTFFDTATVSFKFVPNSSAATGIMMISYPDGGSTNTQAGLAEAKNLFDDPNSGRRSTAKKSIFLVTDGRSNVSQHLTIPNANALKASGVRIFVVAVGDAVEGIDEIVKVASNPPEDNLLRVANMNGFWDLIKLTVEQLHPVPVVPTYPSDPGDPYYKVFQTVPTVSVTVKKFTNNFVCYQTADIVDIVIVLDGSGSIPPDDFSRAKEALKHMMEKLNNPLSDSKFAAVTFSLTATVNFPFLPNSSAASEITKIPHPNSRTNTQAGLAEAKKLFDDPNSGRRSTANKSIFLVTDGKSNVDEHLTIPNANDLRKSGVRIFVVAVGDAIEGIDEIVKVASNPPEDNLLRVANMNGFWDLIKLSVEQLHPGKYQLVDFTPSCN